MAMVNFSLFGHRIVRAGCTNKPRWKYIRTQSQSQETQRLI